MTREPAGYRTLARRLARDLAACIAADDFASRQRGAPMTAREFERRFNRARQTVQRFAAYEATHRGRKGSSAG